MLLELTTRVFALAKNAFQFVALCATSLNMNTDEIQVMYRHVVLNEKRFYLFYDFLDCSVPFPGVWILYTSITVW